MRQIILNNMEVINDSGLDFGRGVFETILIRDKGEFLDFHLERLNEGLEKIGLKKVEEDLKKEIENLNLKNIVLKIIVTEKNIFF